jgi:hypothetical protein
MRAKKQDLPIAFQDGKSYSRDTEWGDMNVAWEDWAAWDATPMFKGLPDDRCQCPHWGYMIKGRMRIKYHDYDEIINAGELYYLPPGHIPVIEEDSEMVEFSPKGEYQKTMEVATRNMEAMKNKS